jgi:hypothetical protein
MNRFIILAVLSFACVAAANREFIFHNHCHQTIWVGSQNNPNKALPSNGGWSLAPGASSTMSVADNWAGRFWGRTGCNFNSAGVGSCQTGDCGNKLACHGAGGNPPASLMEITLNGASGLDFYDVSLVDGYNLPVSMGPIAGTGSGKASPYSCAVAGCVSDLNKICPAELQVHSSNGTVVACKSACEKFNTDAYCCRGAHGTSATCPPTNYSRTFKTACPAAYSYAYDYHPSTFTCKGANYQFIFCPHNL